MTSGARAGINRRGFLKGAAVAAGITVVSSETARSYAANGALRLGVIGCGGRGPWIGNLFQENTNTKVVAVHDYFRDRVNAAGERFGVDSARRHTGLDGYKDLLRGDLDAVAIISPPYFHPEQAVAALEAGKHVYLAKPIAVDAAGCKSIVDAAAKAAGKLSVQVDFQTRKDPLYQEAARRIRDGMIGKPICGQAYYHTGRLGLHAKPGTETARLRNWVFDKALSGAIIVEQNIHVIDVANWFFGAHPIKARGAGGRKGRTDVGDCWDHFIVTYEYPDGALLDFSSNQFAPGFDDLCTRIYGTEGTVDAHYGGTVKIGSKAENWPGGVTSNIYREGAVANIKDFHAAVTGGKALNNAEESAASTMTSILGRVAAYRAGEATWDEVVAANERIDAALKLPEDGPQHDAEPL